MFLLTSKDRVRYLQYYITKALYKDKNSAFEFILMNTTNEIIGINQFLKVDLKPPLLTFTTKQDSRTWRTQLSLDVP